MDINIVQLGRVEYLPTYAAMQEFTNQRSIAPSQSGRDQLWICEHQPVYTQGLAGKPEHIFNPGSIPVVQTNRGGQVTYHGPGQVMGYPLIDLKRAGYFVKEYVYRIEEAVIKTLLYFGVTGHRVAGAPGIYVRLSDPTGHSPLPVRTAPLARLSAGNVGLSSKAEPFDWLRANGVEVGKIAALGIKVSHNCTYHGVALNVAMDLEPFARINPCGYSGLVTTDLRALNVDITWDAAATVLSQKLVTYLSP